MEQSTENITKLIQELSDEFNDQAYKASDKLAQLGTEEVVDAMINLLKSSGPETRIMAARTLGLIRDSERGVTAILEAMHEEGNKEIAGDLLMALEELDLSNEYVTIFRLYLFGTFKVSLVAKGFLDFKEFDITPRTVRKAEKHWRHYSSNVKQDEAYELKRVEVEDMLADLRQFLE